MTQPEMSQALDEGRLIDVATNFHRESVIDGGVDRSNALERARAVIEAAREQLDEMVFEALSTIVDLSGELTLSHTARPETIVGLLQNARQLRDLGELAGFPMATAIAAMLSDILSGTLSEQMAYRADVIRCFVDSLNMFCTAEKRGLSTLEFPELLNELSLMQSRVLPQSE